MTVLFPDINVILSLFTGSIGGTLLFILPVFFYQAAYQTIPSKKDRKLQSYLGYAILILAIPIGICGVIYNIKEIIN